VIPKDSRAHKLDPQFVTGFTDGDGSFSINILNVDGKFYPSLSFKFGIHVKDLVILNRIL
jgi:LAGLIDADG endonuclease